MDRVNRFKSLANRSLQVALTLDEQQKREPAIRAYTLAAHALQQAAAVASATSITAPLADRAEAAAVAASMNSRAVHVKERLGQLRSAQSAQHGASTTAGTQPSRLTRAASSPAGRMPTSASPPRLPSPSASVTRQTSSPSSAWHSGTAATAPMSAPVKQASTASSEVLDPALIATIESEILDSSPNVSFDDISGMDDAKAALHEMIVLPAKRPDLYKGLRTPSKGILLFGPPGTGKTLCAKAVASASNATFFSISASSLGSKFHGESEKLMKALFYVARQRQPAFIFIDEIDSLLGSRGEGEHEASRRLKTEFLVQFDGAAGSKDDAVYVMGATNRPFDLDDAVRRRLNKRIYVPLPDQAGRFALLKKLTLDGEKDVKWKITKADLQEIAATMEFFSGADIQALCREAALMPLRELGARIANIEAKNVRPVTRKDLMEARARVRPAASRGQLQELDKWDREFGSSSHSRSSSSAGDRGPNGSNHSSTGSRKTDVARRKPSGNFPSTGMGRAFLPVCRGPWSAGRGY